jgi:hypothetical protein
MADLKRIDQLIREYEKPFSPGVTYSELGDCAEFYFQDADCFAERVDCWLTVYRDMDSKKVAGFMLKNVKTLLSAFDQLGLECRVRPASCEISVYGIVEKMPWVNPESARTPSYLDILHRRRELQAATFELVGT